MKLGSARAPSDCKLCEQPRTKTILAQACPSRTRKTVWQPSGPHRRGSEQTREKLKLRVRREFRWENQHIEKLRCQEKVSTSSLSEHCSIGSSPDYHVMSPHQSLDQRSKYQSPREDVIFLVSSGNESYSNLFVSVLYHFVDDSSTHSLCSCQVSQTLKVSVRDSCCGLRVVDFTTFRTPNTPTNTATNLGQVLPRVSIQTNGC